MSKFSSSTKESCIIMHYSLLVLNSQITNPVRFVIFVLITWKPPKNTFRSLSHCLVTDTDVWCFLLCVFFSMYGTKQPFLGHVRITVLISEFSQQREKAALNVKQHQFISWSHTYYSLQHFDNMLNSRGNYFIEV